jgi:dTDP-4-dehydrorhamnose reductase
VLTVLRLAREKPELSMVIDQSGSPTWARWLAQATAALVRRRDVVTHRGGIYHLAATGQATRYEFAAAIIDIMKQISGESSGWAKLKPITTDQYPLPAPRPPRPVMRMGKVAQVFGVTPPHWQEQLHDFLEELAKSTRLGV